MAGPRAAGLSCRPRDIFVEQTVAGLARVVGVADTHRPIDEGIGDVAATPIIRWLSSVDGPVDQFNQTMVLQAPAGVELADVTVVLQALLDRHAMLRLRVDDGPGGWKLTVPEPDSAHAAALLHTVDALTDETIIAARSRLSPAGGVMLSAVWASTTRQLALIIHHLAVDAAQPTDYRCRRHVADSLVDGPVRVGHADHPGQSGHGLLDEDVARPAAEAGPPGPRHHLQWGPTPQRIKQNWACLGTTQPPRGR
ncbi:hypothetical protein, partial [Mycobacterium sp. E1715]|uniref:hypothetical protein n=1 Tax=Mycobacterium sp. E1715 TaxID=1856863 RepID=UPI0035172663